MPSFPDKLIIATPIDGTPETAKIPLSFHNALMVFVAAGARVVPQHICFSDDLSRARSRCVWFALNNPGWDWLLFWDDDVIPKDLNIVEAMVRCAEKNGLDWLAAPYPRKRINASFPYKPSDADFASGNLSVIDGDHVEVDFIAIGFTIISRKCLEEMVGYYKDEWFTDLHDKTNIHETVALFRQVMTPEGLAKDPEGNTIRFRDLYSEDYSACWRWRQMGGRVFMYVGEGAPLAHFGEHTYTGKLTDLGNVR